MRFNRLREKCAPLPFLDYMEVVSTQYSLTKLLILIIELNLIKYMPLSLCKSTLSSLF
jgi:hypothetical protein